jgi:hypothetical protein
LIQRINRSYTVGAADPFLHQTLHNDAFLHQTTHAALLMARAAHAAAPGRPGNTSGVERRCNVRRHARNGNALLRRLGDGQLKHGSREAGRRDRQAKRGASHTALRCCRMAAEALAGTTGSSARYQSDQFIDKRGPVFA